MELAIRKNAKRPDTAKNTTVSKRGYVGEGRPRVQWDYRTITKLAKIQCTQAEICSFLNCSEDAFQRDPQCMEIFGKWKDHGRISVRRAQYREMLKGNSTMLIWLGKQYLGQRDHQVFSGPNDTPLIPAVTSEEGQQDLARRIAFMLVEADDSAKKAIGKASASSKQTVQGA